MKILLVGEFSGLHTYLAKGLKQLGHEVKTASNGDGFKNFPRDFDLKGNTITRRAKEISLAFSFQKYDVVQFINPMVFSRLGSLSLLKKLISNNSKSFLLAVGDDYFFWKAYRDGKYRYSPLKDFLLIDRNNEAANIWETPKLKAINLKLADMVNGIIPGLTEYNIAYVGHPKLKKLIPFPIDVENISYNENLIQPNGKIKIFHGVQKQRKGFKGTDIIDKGVAKLQETYPSKIEYIRPENVSFNEYLKMLQDANIVIDQVNSFSPAMNALIAMAMGKIVVGGAEDEYLDVMELAESPIVNVTPDPDDVFAKLEKIIMAPQLIQDWGQRSREFVEKHHACKIVAQRFVDIWAK